MEDLVKALGRLASRDIPYIVGGTSVILSFLHIFINISIPIDLSIPVALLFMGIAYAVGYTVQDALSLTPIINSSIVVRPRALLKWLYKKWTRAEWAVTQDFDVYPEYFQMYADSDSEKAAPIERIIFLKTVGNAIGSNWFVSSLLLGVKGGIDPTAFNISLAIAVFIISILLIILGWLQGLEAMNALYSLNAKRPRTSVGGS